MGDIQNKAQEFKGAAKEKFGRATDNPSLEGEGAAEKAKAQANQPTAAADDAEETADTVQDETEL